MKDPCPWKCWGNEWKHQFTSIHHEIFIDLRYTGPIRAHPGPTCNLMMLGWEQHASSMIAWNGYHAADAPWDASGLDGARKKYVEDYHGLPGFWQTKRTKLDPSIIHDLTPVAIRIRRADPTDACCLINWGERSCLELRSLFLAANGGQILQPNPSGKKNVKMGAPLHPHH